MVGWVGGWLRGWFVARVVSFRPLGCQHMCKRRSVACMSHACLSVAITLHACLSHTLYTYTDGTRVSESDALGKATSLATGLSTKACQPRHGLHTAAYSSYRTHTVYLGVMRTSCKPSPLCLPYIVFVPCPSLSHTCVCVCVCLRARSLSRARPSLSLGETDQG